MILKFTLHTQIIPWSNPYLYSLMSTCQSWSGPVELLWVDLLNVACWPIQLTQSASRIHHPKVCTNSSDILHLLDSYAQSYAMLWWSPYVSLRLSHIGILTLPWSLLNIVHFCDSNLIFIVSWPQPTPIIFWLSWEKYNGYPTKLEV